MSFRDSNPDKDHDRRIDLEETRHVLPRYNITWRYTAPPRRRLRYWLKTIWRLFVPGGPSNG